MRLTIRAVLACAAFMVACSDEPNAPQRSSSDVPAPLFAKADKIDGEYIVVLNDDADVDALAAELGIKPKHLYKAALKGFAGKLSDDELAALRVHSAVAYIEEDQEMTTSTTVTAASWGLDRIDQRTLPLSGTYTYNATSSAVRAYVIDTGILTSHTQFGGRVSNVYDAFGGSGTDCHGHGTHVAGTIGGSTYGLARAVRLRGVRVLNCSGSGAISGIIAAVDWVRVNAIK